MLGRRFDEHADSSGAEVFHLGQINDDAPGKNCAQW